MGSVPFRLAINGALSRQWRRKAVLRFDVSTELHVGLPSRSVFSPVYRRVEGLMGCRLNA
jgi:hypothetical protein